MERRARSLLLLLPLLIAAVAAVLFAEGRAAPRRATRAESFSHLLGGPVEFGAIPDRADYHPWYATSERLSSARPDAPDASREDGDAFHP